MFLRSQSHEGLGFESRIEVLDQEDHKRALLWWNEVRVLQKTSPLQQLGPEMAKLELE